MNTATLSRVLFQSAIDKQIGMDYSAGFQWRPTLNDQIVVTAAASIFMPSAGFKNLLTARPAVRAVRSADAAVLKWGRFFYCTQSNEKGRPLFERGGDDA